MNGPDTQRAAAAQRADALVQIIREIGLTGSLRNIAAALNEAPFANPRYLNLAAGDQ